MVIQGHIQNGVVVPTDALTLPNGTEVTIMVPGSFPAPPGTMSDEQKSRYHKALAKIDSVPNENPGDSFSGVDHDQALYGA